MPPVYENAHREARYIPLPGDVLSLPDRLARVPGLFEIPLVRRPLGVTYIYFLCQRQHPQAPGWPDQLMVDRIGQTTQLPKRIYDHVMQRERDGLAPIERVFGIAAPVEGSNALEEGLIREFMPLYNRQRLRSVGGLRDEDRAALRALGYPAP